MPESLTNRLHELARTDVSGFPVLSVYLNTEPDGTGRPTYEPFLRKELPDRAATYAERSPERESLDADIARVEQYVATELQPSTRGLAIFACQAAGLFEAMQLETPFAESSVVVSDRPYLYPLALVEDEHPRYAAVLLDTNLARIVVFGLGQTVDSDEVRNEKTRQHKAGGWSQARFQRHVGQQHLQHVKEVVQRLEEIVARDKVDHIVLAGDEVVVPMLRAQLPEALAKKVVDVLRLDIRSPEHEVLEETLEALRRNDEQTDEAVVQDVVDEFRAGGLGVVGFERVKGALTLGQVHTLVIAAAPDAVEGGAEAANELVLMAAKTSAAVRFIENRDLLGPYGGAAATLRFRL
jgi:peptide subunit release factor 1 (eRF1)